MSNPDFAKAIIDTAKFAHYSLNPDNPRNNSKWRAFAELGYDVATSAGRDISAEHILAQIRPQLSTTTPTLIGNTEYGERYKIEVLLTGPNNGMGMLTLIWQMEGVEPKIPRWITNFLKVHWQRQGDYDESE